MKETKVMFIIGILVGAVIASGLFYIYKNNNSKNCDLQTTQMNDENPPEMPNGKNGQPPKRTVGENSNSTKSNRQSKKSSSDNTNKQSDNEKDLKTKENN